MACRRDPGDGIGRVSQIHVIIILMANPTPWSDLSPRERRQRLIAQATPSESQFQAMLNTHARTSGKYEFQSPISTFWADFLFPREKLIVELDGAVHSSRDAKAADKR